MASRPTQMQKTRPEERAVIGGLAGFFFALILGAFSLSVADHYLLRSGSLAAVVSAALVDLVNGDRAGETLDALHVSSVLTAAAQAKADDMATKSYFAHTSPEGKNSWYWFKQAGYSFLYAGENLAVDFSDTVDVEQALMNSPTHRANILSEHFTEVGIATAEGVYQGRPTTFVVQLFGTPTDSAPAPSEVEAVVSAKATELAVATRVATSVAPATLGVQADSIHAPTTSWLSRLVTAPKTILEYVYGVCALLLLLVLAYVTELEFHKRHMRHVVAVVFLCIVMAGLLVVADVTFFSAPVLAALGG